MQVTTHGELLVKLTRFPLLGPMSCYFVREDDGLTLIDSTISSSAGSIIAAADRIGMPIVRLAITHAHDDHVGALERLRDQYPAAEVLIGAREDVSGLKAPPTRLLSEGERVGSLEVVDSPGHTPGHIAFIDTRDRSLVAGDAFVTRGGVEVAGTLRLLMPFPHIFTADRSAALDSARRLRALSPTRLAVGHGRVVESPSEAMERAIARAEQRLARA